MCDRGPMEMRWVRWIATVMAFIHVAVAGTVVYILFTPVKYHSGGVVVCTKYIWEETCTRVTPEGLQQLTGMVLPPDVVIEKAEYDAFTDWSLQATFVVPSTDVEAWQASLVNYATASEDTCDEAVFPEVGTGRLCAIDPNSTFYSLLSYAPLGDGSMRVGVDMVED